MSESTAPRLLIVCTANAIRSPFVEHLLRARLVEMGGAEVQIRSAGAAARPGMPAEPNVVEVGRAHGIHLDDHRTRLLDESMLSPGTTVLCAEAAHRRTVLDMRPGLLDTTFTVREFARLLGDEGPPAGAGWESLIRAAAQLRTRVRRGSAREDDLVDPIGQPPTVWAEFERQAVGAVETIAHAVAAAVVDGGDGPAIPLTRRALRARRTP